MIPHYNFSPRELGKATCISNSVDILRAAPTCQVRSLLHVTIPTTLQIAVINYYPVSGTSLIFIIAHLHDSFMYKREKDRAERRVSRAGSLR